MNNNDMEIIRKALLKYFALEEEKIESLPGPDPEEKKKIDERVLKTIDDYFEEKKKRSKTVKTPIKILIVAAIITALIITCISCAEMIRNFFIEISDISIDFIGKSKEDIVGEVKDEIEETFMPSYIPEGYKLASEPLSYDNTMAYWEKNSEEIISLSQLLVIGGTISIDNEHVVDKGTKYINGADVNYILVKTEYVIVWDQYGYRFLLACPESIGWDEIEKIVSSLEVNNVYED